MATPIRPPRPKIRRAQLNRRQPVVGIDALALMLEIDLSLGHRNHFRRRLHRALEDARAQGAKRA
jgi:hypothetical protein